MKTLTLTRPHIKNYNENAIAIYINGKIVARLKDNETKEIRLKEENVEVQAKFLKWFGSPKQLVTLEDNTTIIQVNILPNFYNQALVYLGPILAASSTLFGFHQKVLSFILLTLGLGVFIYSIFFRRDKWLSLNIQ